MGTFSTLSDEDILEWDVHNWAKALAHWNLQADQLAGNKALELGGRNGGLSLFCASRGAQVICSDLDGPTDLAKKRHKDAGFAEMIDYASINALDLPYTEELDIVCFKSVLGGVGRNGNNAAQAQCIAEIYRALKPGGLLIFAENLEASPVHQMIRKRAVHWGEAWNYTSIDRLQQQLQNFGEVDICSFGFLGTFGRSNAQRQYLGKLDSLIFDRLVPNRWHYIASVVARK